MHTPPITRRTLSVRVLLATILIGVLGLISVGAAATTSASGGDPVRDRPTIVLVHGSFADASGFNDVIQRLQALRLPHDRAVQPAPRHSPATPPTSEASSTPSTDRSSSSLTRMAAS